MLEVRSPAFHAGGMIPIQFTGDGEDLSPPLVWTPGPAGTVTYALTVDDPDASGGAWIHWLLWNLNRTSLPQGFQAATSSSQDESEGTNSWGRIGYGGPRPPSGVHRYYFRVVALSRRLSLERGASRSEFEAASTGCLLDQGELMGTYARAGKP